MSHREAVGEALVTLLSPPVGWILAFVWGALWGSFFNVAIHRLAREDARLRDLLAPPSHCPACTTPIRAFDNVPILAWLWLRGRCRACKAPISIRYPLVELAGALAGMAVYYLVVLEHPDAPPLMVARFLLYFYFVGTLLVLALIDLDTMLLPEAITLPAIPFFFVTALLLHDVERWDLVIGLAVGFGGLKALEVGYRAATGRDGLGGGDSMLMAIVGGFLGWRALPFTLGLGATVGTLVTLPLLVIQRRRARRDAASQQANAAAQHGDVAAQHGDIAAQQGDGAAQQVDRAAQQGTGDDDDDSIRHVEVPFGPFLVVGALAYLFLHQWAWAWLTGLADRP